MERDLREARFPNGMEVGTVIYTLTTYIRADDKYTRFCCEAVPFLSLSFSSSSPRDLFDCSKVQSDPREDREDLKEMVGLRSSLDG